MKYRLIIMCISILCATVCYSENYSEILSRVMNNVASPTAQDLGKYGEIPMNLYTGRANVSIPIYQTTQKDVTLNINLSYDTGGLLVSQLPSWTGHGWTLNAGGCITRRLQGYYDEDKNNVHIFGVSRSIMPDLVNYFDNPRTLDGKTNEEIADDVSNASKVYDYSPDIFVFSFMGKTGRFFFGPDKKWHVQCDENIKVVFDVNDQSNYILPFIPTYPRRGEGVTMSKTIKGFTLIDENGTKYKFGGTTDAIEYSIGFFDQDVEDWRANSWYLTEVQDRFGNILYNFKYKRGKFLVQIFNNLVQTSTFYQFSNGYVFQRYRTTESNAAFPLAITLNAPIYLSNITTFDKTSIDFTLSDKIKIPLMDFYQSFDRYCKDYVIFDDAGCYNSQNNGRVPYILNMGDYHNVNNMDYLCYLRNHLGYAKDFPQYWDDDARKTVLSKFANNESIETGGQGFDNPLAVLSFNPLQSIEISNKKSSSDVKKIKFIDFVYDLENRLHITAINMYGEKGKSGNGQVYSYQMEYKDYDKIPKDYLSDQFDYWGYYNNNSNSNSANPSTTQYGMMTKLVYPTGGYSKFIYEQNSYSQVQNDERNNMVIYDMDQLTGGLRIAQIKNYSANDELFQTRNFSYKNIGYDEWMNSGQCYRIPRSDKAESYRAKFSRYEYVNKDIYYKYKKGSTVPLTDTYGSHVGYSWVTETIGNIKKEYKYSNYSDYYDEVPLRVANETISDKKLDSPYVRFTDLGFARGKLLKERIYENDDLKYECDYRYSYFDRNKHVQTTTFSRYPDVHLQDGFLVGCLYRMYYCNLELEKKMEVYYNVGSKITNVTEYKMEDLRPNSKDLSFSLRKLTSETFTRMVGGKVFDSQEKMYLYLTSELNDHFFPITDILTFRNGEQTMCHSVVYDTFANVPNHKLPAKEIVTQYPSFQKHIKVTYDQYDTTGQLLQFTETGKPTTYLSWDSYGRLIKTANGAPDSYITYYDYTFDGQINKITSPNGNFTNYNYDSFGRLNAVSDVNGKTIQKMEYNYRTK